MSYRTVASSKKEVESASWDADAVLIYGYYVDTSCFEISHFFKVLWLLCCL